MEITELRDKLTISVTVGIRTEAHSLRSQIGMCRESSIGLWIFRIQLQA